MVEPELPPVGMGKEVVVRDGGGLVTGGCVTGACVPGPPLIEGGAFANDFPCNTSVNIKQYFGCEKLGCG